MPKSSSASRTPVARSADSAAVAAASSAQHGLLGDLELQLPRRQRGEIHHIRDLGHPAGLGQLDRRDVHAHVRRPRPQLAPPCGGLPARLGEHPAAQRHDRAAALRRLDEPARAEQPVLGVLPAHERLGAAHPAVGQAHERLVVQQELAALHPVAHPGEQRRPGRLAGVAVGVEHRDPPAALRLRPRQRDVRGPQEVGGRGRGRARHGDADARRDLHGPPAHPERAGPAPPGCAGARPRRRGGRRRARRAPRTRRRRCG